MGAKAPFGAPCLGCSSSILIGNGFDLLNVNVTYQQISPGRDHPGGGRDRFVVATVSLVQ